MRDMEIIGILLGMTFGIVLLLAALLLVASVLIL